MRGLARADATFESSDQPASLDTASRLIEDSKKLVMKSMAGGRHRKVQTAGDDSLSAFVLGDERCQSSSPSRIAQEGADYKKVWCTSN